VTEPSPAVIDVARHRRRLMWMIAVDAVCFLVALAAIIGNVSFNIHWLLWVFLAAMLAGFGAQGWLIMGLTRKD
jgi:hypothetical protein